MDKPTPAFGVGGRALVPLTRLAAPIATLSDGSVLVAGFLGASQLGLVHLLADGSPDQQFGQGGVATLIPVIFGSSATMRLLVQPDGRIVIVAIEGGTIIRVLRREPDGSPDAGFAEGDVVEVIGQRLLDVASAADGGVRVATLSRRLLTDDEGLVNLSVLRPDGTSAGTATVPAVMANPNARGIAGVYQADGKLLLVDQGAAAPALRRLNADGTVDVEPQELGALAGLITQEIALRPDGSLLVRAAPPPGSAIVSTIVARVEATACGNGIVEPGESCDEGVGRNGSPDGCCSATCAAAPDQDGDGICDARDLCTDVDGGRGFDAGSTLRLRRANVQDPAEDRLLLVAQIRLPPGTTFSTLDPENEGFRLVLTDQTGATSLDVALPAGSFAGRGTRGWQRRRAGRRLKYRDLTDAPLGGIRTVRIDDDATTPGEVTVTVRGPAVDIRSPRTRHRSA
jgi:uncharacterized delta-60 repeat protein